VYSDHKSIQIPSSVFAYVGGFALVLMMLHVVADVTGREVFGIPLDGTLEIVSFYNMVAVTFLPLAYVAHNEGHISVELFTRNMRRRRLAALEAVVGILCLAFVVIMVRETWIAAMNSYDSGEMWETSDDLITIWPSRFVLPIGVALMGVYMVYRIADDIRIARSGSDVEPASDP